MSQAWLRSAGIFCFTGVALGAFGAHGLRARISPELLEVYRTGVLYHLLHALALLVVVLAAERIRTARTVAWCFTLGIAIFGGSLYALALTGARWLGAITPIGGTLFLAGWVALAWGARPKT